MGQQIKVDISSGGNGDIWMRLVSFYSVLKLMPSLTIYVYVPPFMRSLSEYTFGDRILFVDDKANCEYIFTSLGLKGMLKGIFAGKKYIAPYHRAVIHDKAQQTLKDSLNIAMFNVADFFSIVQVPAWKWIEKYQGYLDIIGLKKIQKIGYEQYIAQLEEDYSTVFNRLNDEQMPTSPELVIPDDLGANVVVFPTGTSRQFVPVWWAKEHLPDAYYAFFIKDTDALTFLNNGLKVVYFYKEPGDIIKLSHKAAWTITTDSFPSHLLQYATQKCTVTITEVKKSRIISPAYNGKVIDAVAPCHPCLHLERKQFPTCMAGHTECINWKSAIYTKNVVNSIQNG